MTDCCLIEVSFALDIISEQSAQEGEVSQVCYRVAQQRVGARVAESSQQSYIVT